MDITRYVLTQEQPKNPIGFNAIGPIGFRRYRQAFQTILTSPWFRRVWIVQEVANARAATIYCGPLHVPAEVFAFGATLSGVECPPHCQAILDIMPGLRRKTSWWSKKPDFYTILWKFSKAKATQEHDMIYALLGLCPPAIEKVLVDYTKPIKCVIRDAISFICGFDTGDLELEAFNTAKGFAINIERLHQNVLVAMMRPSHLHLVGQFLQENEGYCQITPELQNTLNGFSKAGSVAAVGLLSQIGRGPNLRSWKSRETLLHAAVSGGHFAVVQRLLDSGARCDTRSSNGQTPLHAAVNGGHLTIVQRLLDNGAPTDTQDCRGKTPLLVAATGGHFAIFQRLLYSGARYDIQDSDGKTPLHAAANGGHLDIVQRLLDIGAPSDTQNIRGKTPLFAAAIGGHLAIVQRLLDSGARCDTRDSDGKTPLHAAASGGRLDIVQRLLDSGARSDIQDIKGQTPHDKALIWRNYEVAKLLRERGTRCSSE